MTGVATESTAVPRTNRTALDAAPIAIWEEDFSEIAAFCEERWAAGTTDIRAYLDSFPFVLADLVGTIRVVNVNETAVQLAGAEHKETLLGAIPPELLSKDSWNTFIDQVVGIFEGRDRLTSVSRGVDLHGSPTWHTVHWAAPTADGVVDYARVLVMIEDTTSHHVAQLERIAHERELRALIDIGARVASTLDEQSVFRQIVDTVPELTGADQALILLFERETETLTTAYGHGYADAEVATHEYAEVMDGISGWVCEHLEATLSDDIANDPRNRGKSRARAERFPGTSAAVAPILRDGISIGTLSALNGPESPGFTARQLSLIETLAAQAAVAINNAHIYETSARSHAELQLAHRDLQDTQTQLLAAQKMEAIGSLAAGIAHEINTPIQFVGDNIRFIQESSEAVFSLLDVLAPAIDQIEAMGHHADLVAKYREVEEQADVDFIREETPLAISQSLEGIERVAEIVRAMKEFAHPGSEEKASIDLNRNIETTVSVAKNEWKYVADLVLDLDPSMPLVPALVGPLNQSLLIMIVNAAQAIGDAAGASGPKGSITIATTVQDDSAVITVTDSGPGIPSSIVDRIFDPFFTTKEVGKGSGQGLSIARSVIVDKHGGTLQVQTAGGEGTTFIIRLPLTAEDPR